MGSGHLSRLIAVCQKQREAPQQQQDTRRRLRLAQRAYFDCLMRMLSKSILAPWPRKPMWPRSFFSPG